MQNLQECVSCLKEWIIDSEMGGKLDKSDPFYPAYRQLIILDEKLQEMDE